ncbi:MAG: redoxin domain-containing protein, partial [Xanthomonadales bacterium]|nr:redoxin domain-containing protein [Xanthomonadales bacterium]
MRHLLPRQPAPALEFETLKGPWNLADQRPEHFTMVAFYRGLHCPICKGQLRDLDRKLGDFAELGVDVIAVSG